VVQSGAIWCKVGNLWACWACPDFLDRDLECLSMGVDLFEVQRGMVVQGTMESPRVVEGFDIIEDGQASLVMGSKGVVVEGFGFERTPEGFHSGIIIAVAGGAHTGKSF